MDHEVEMVIASHPRWLRLVRSFVQEFAAQVGFDSQERQAITLAVGEAVSNVIKHSYKGDPSRKVSLICHADNGGVEVEVRDQGEPYDPSARPMRPPEELRAGGRGVYLIRATMDEVEYRREGKTNCVRMRKFLKSHAG